MTTDQQTAPWSLDRPRSISIKTASRKSRYSGSQPDVILKDVTLASLLKDEGYVTAQFGKDTLGDKDKFL